MIRIGLIQSTEWVEHENGMARVCCHPGRIFDGDDVIEPGEIEGGEIGVTRDGANEISFVDGSVDDLDVMAPMFDDGPTEPVDGSFGSAPGVGNRRRCQDRHLHGAAVRRLRFIAVMLREEMDHTDKTGAMERTIRGGRCLWSSS